VVEEHRLETLQKYITEAHVYERGGTTTRQFAGDTGLSYGFAFEALAAIAELLGFESNGEPMTSNDAPDDSVADAEVDYPSWRRGATQAITKTMGLLRSDRWSASSSPTRSSPDVGCIEPRHHHRHEYHQGHRQVKKQSAHVPTDSVGSGERESEAVLPATMYEELGGDPPKILSGSEWVDQLIEQGWVDVAPRVSGDSSASFSSPTTRRKKLRHAVDHAIL